MENLEVSFEEIYENQDYSNSDNFKELLKKNNKSDIILTKDGRIIVSRLKEL